MLQLFCVAALGHQVETERRVLSWIAVCADGSMFDVFLNFKGPTGQLCTAPFQKQQFANNCAQYVSMCSEGEPLHKTGTHLL